MKKAVKLLSVLILGMLVSMPVYAEAEPEPDVWCETGVENKNLSVSIETNGKATDGVISIGYKSSIIDCTEDDVKINESVVDMYSVNVIDGSVRISFLAEDAIEAGTFAEVVFNVVDENADEETLKSAITFLGEIYDADGESVLVKTVEEEEPGNSTDPDESPAPIDPDESPAPTDPPTPTNPDDPENPDETEKPQNPVGGTDAGSGDGNASKATGTVTTGDDTDFSAYLILSLVTGGLLAAFAVRKIVAVTGRKLNH